MVDEPRAMGAGSPSTAPTTPFSLKPLTPATVTVTPQLSPLEPPTPITTDPRGIVRVSSPPRPTRPLSRPKSKLNMTYVAGDEPPAPVRALALDGGGVRGLSEIVHLLELQKYLIKKGYPADCRPCDIFDIIGGSSTGGLIALMFVRLQMSIEEVLYVYEDLSRTIFSSPTLMQALRYYWTGSALNTSVIEKQIQSIVMQKMGVRDAPVASKSTSCKV